MTTHCLALHGNLGSHEDFAFLKPLQNQSISIDAINLWPYSNLSLEETAEQLQSKVAPNSRNGIIGYSMGGRIALQTLCSFPKVFDFAVIISAHPGLPSAQDRANRLKTDQQWAQRVRNLDWGEFLKLWNQQSILKDQPPSAGQQALKPHREAIANAFENWSLGQQPNLAKALANYTNELHWLVGENDQKFSDLAKSLKQQNLPNFHLHTQPKAGHRLIFEQPNELVSIIKNAIFSADKSQ